VDDAAAETLKGRTVSMAYGWDEMIAEFRALGGTADNIVQASGSLGRGIFPIERDKPIRIQVPANLLVPAADIQFVDGRIEIKESAKIGQAEREFFEKYQNSFSWGIARRECAAYVEGMKNLPPDTKEQLYIPAGLEGRSIEEGADVAWRWFLNSRCIKAGDKLCVMPLMELVNHGVGAKGYDTKNGISIEGQFSDEVLVHYTLGDPLSIFLTFGFASPERICFSLPALRKGPRDVLIQRDINFKSKRASFAVPDFKIEDNQVTLSGLMIGNKRAPKLSRGVFVSIMKEAGIPEPELEFDTILHINRMGFLSLLGKVEPVRGELGRTIRTMIRYQLEAMSHCIGTREL
jgi:hypothetical protein